MRSNRNTLSILVYTSEFVESGGAVESEVKGHWRALMMSSNSLEQISQNYLKGKRIMYLSMDNKE